MPRIVYLEAEDGSRILLNPPHPPGETQRYNLTVYPDTPTIVCVRPLIVLVCPQPQTFSQFPTPSILDHSGGPRPKKLEKQLRYGYHRGSVGSCSDGLTWYSPDLNIPPQPLLFDDQGVALIPTHWGNLKIQKGDSGAWSTAAIRYIPER
ncbi:MAG: hypothetical protein KF757_02880 [Phycisphaeraceae bacterium]|nr:hypothetical protein [Phycisphaeraceae bacterium]MCW5762126.1 hypothetical protein [Phycisphaeraceae bacterium]